MKNRKIVADSSANLLALGAIPFAAAPMKVVTPEREFVDDETLNLPEMVEFFLSYKGKSSTSCPNPTDWLTAFGDAEEVFAVTITSALSGSCNAARVAGRMYEEAHPGRRVFIIDSLSAGPELTLIIEKLAEYIPTEMTYEEITEAITAYTKTTGLLFMLSSLHNFAANGRVSPAVAKIAGVLGIRVVGRASSEGTLEPLHKSRGEAGGLSKLLSELAATGFTEGKLYIAHCLAEGAAERLAEQLRSAFPKAQVQVSTVRGLCSYYAEPGGLLVGYEKA